MNNRIITATAWACALAVLFYRRALVPLALLALDVLTSSQGDSPSLISLEDLAAVPYLPDHFLGDRVALGLITQAQAPPAAPLATLGEGLTNAEIKAILGIKGNRTRAQLLERLKNSQTPPIHRYSPCTTPATPKTSRSNTADSWTSSARAKTQTAATTSPASSARSKP